MKNIHIWSIPLNFQQCKSQYSEFLSQEEVDRAARFHFARDAQRYIIGRALLRLILSHYTNLPARLVQFTYNCYGKPALATGQNPHGLEFNLSHAGDHALCAVCYGHAIGIDIEEVRDLNYCQLATTVFSTREQASLKRLSTGEQPLAFFHGWTRKEAYVKAQGKGLSLALADFDVTLAPDEPAQLLATRPDPSEVQRWSLYSLPVGESYVAALAVARYGWCLQWRESRELL